MRWLNACIAAAALVAGAAVWAADAPPQATSADGRWRVAAEGQALAVYEHGVRVKMLDVSRRDGQQRSTVAEIHAVPQRRSFVIAFDSLAELWELSIDPNAEPLFDGLVHDWRLGEGTAEPGFLGLRRTPLGRPLRELQIDDSGAFVLGRETEEGGLRGALRLVQLDVRRAIARFAAPS